VLLLCGGGTAQQSVDDPSGLEQVGNARDTRRWVGIRLAAGSNVRPDDGHKSPASIGKDDEQLMLTFAVRSPQDLKRPPFEGMGSARDGDG
jgi:hypothetical protein